MASLNSSYCFQLTCFTSALASSPPTFTLWAKYHGNRSLSVASSSPCLNISITDGTVRSLDRRLRSSSDEAVSARGKRSCTRQRTYGHPKVWFFFGKTISRKIFQNLLWSPWTVPTPAGPAAPSHSTLLANQLEKVRKIGWICNLNAKIS